MHQKRKRNGQQAHGRDDEKILKLRSVAQKLSMQRRADDVHVDFGAEHFRDIGLALNGPRRKRGFVKVLEEVGGGADEHDLAAKEFSVLVILPPDFWREHCAEG